MRIQLNPQLRLPLIGAGAFTLGSAAGWLICSFRTRKTIDQLLERIDWAEANVIKSHELEAKLTQVGDALRDRTKTVKGVMEMLEALPEQHVTDQHPSIAVLRRVGEVEEQPQLELIQELPQPEPVEESVTPDKVIHIFPANEEEWDDDKERENRDSRPGQPYIINRDEYFDSETGFNQVTYTFYEGDQVLSDERDVPVYDPGSVVGPLLFGKGSGDPNVVYIRNPKLKTEYEILKHTGHYLVEVLGETIEHAYEEKDLKHSSDRRFRDGD